MRNAKIVVALLLDEATHYVDQARPAVHQTQPASVPEILTPKFLDYIKQVENETQVGWNKAKKRWYPFKDPSGGFDIGYGHKLNSPAEHSRYAKTGMSSAEVDKQLVQDLLAAREKVYAYIRKTYGVNLLLTPKQEQMLIDYAYNFGNLGRVPRMVDAILRNDQSRIKKEYRRFANIGGKTRELTSRNNAFASTFLGTP